MSSSKQITGGLLRRAWIRRIGSSAAIALLLLSFLAMFVAPAKIANAAPSAENCTFRFVKELSEDGWITAGIAPGDEFLAVVGSGRCDGIGGDNQYFVYDPANAKYRFAQNGNGPIFVSVNPSELENNNNATVTGSLWEIADGGPNGGNSISVSDAQVARDFININPPDDDAVEEDVDTTPEEEEEGEAAGGVDDSTCDSNVELDLSWLICPVIKITGSVINWMDTQIAALLAIDENKYRGDTLYAAWSQIRNISYIILIPIMLVMVLGTALGFEVFSAYTIKRALPRMVAAVIFITFSWYITGFLIDLSNVVGSGIMGLMTAPFGNIMGSLNQLSLADLFQADGDSLYATILAQMGITVGTIVLLALFFPVMAMIVASAFFILLLRQMFIVALVLVAPLAILAWIFPGNDKLWKLWWDAFTKLLMMFPIIMAIIAVGRIFAVLIVSTQAGFAESAINPIMTVGAYLLPYAFIPFTFKLAGGIFATLTGMVNDREKGFFDKQRQNRAEKRERAGADKFFNPNGRFNRFNRAASWMADPKNNARIKFGTRGGLALASELTQKSAQQSQDLAKWMSSAGFNQEALTAIMDNVKANKGKLNANALMDTAKEWTTARNEDGSMKYDTQYIAAASQILNSGSFLQDIYKSEDFNRANIGMAAGLAKASQGFLNSKNPNELADYANFLNDSDQGGAPGLGDTFKTQAGLMLGQGGGLGKVGYSEQAYVDRDGNIQLTAGGVAARATQLARASVREITGAKASQLQEHFIANGALESILTQDEIVDPRTGQKVKMDPVKRAAIMDNIAQAAYGYDTPAETAAVLRAEMARLKGLNPETGSLITDAENRALRKNVPEGARDGGPPPGPPDDGH